MIRDFKFINSSFESPQCFEVVQSLDLLYCLQVLCIIIAALLQFFFISMFCWMMVEGLQLWLTMITGKSKDPARTKYFYIVGYCKSYLVLLSPSKSYRQIVHVRIFSRHWRRAHTRDITSCVFNLTFQPHTFGIKPFCIWSIEGYRRASKVLSYL